MTTPRTSRRQRPAAAPDPLTSGCDVLAIGPHPDDGVSARHHGVSPFTGNAVWLQLAVRTNGVGDFATLSPRQRIAPAPYAIAA